MTPMIDTATDMFKFAKGELDFYNMSQLAQTVLYEHFIGDMPYGVAKARTGDPDQWIAEHVEEWSLDDFINIC